MNKFTDFSDQVTFVSSELIGRDFGQHKKNKNKNNNNGVPYNAKWFNNLSDEEKLIVINAINSSNGNKGSSNKDKYYEDYRNSKENLEKYSKSFVIPDSDAEYENLNNKKLSYEHDWDLKSRDLLKANLDYNKLLEDRSILNSYKGTIDPSEWNKNKNDLDKKISEFENDFIDTRKAKLYSDKGYTDILGSISDYRNKKLNEDFEYSNLKKSFKTASDAWSNHLENQDIQTRISNLKLGKEESKLKRQQDIREDGGRVRHGIINLINTVQRSKEGSSLPEFHNKDWEGELPYTPEKGGLIPEGVYEKDGKWYQKHKKDSITGYLADNGDAFAKAAGKAVTTAGKTAGNAIMRMTGYDPDKDSERTSKLKSKLESNKNRQIKSLGRIVRNETKYQDKHGAVSDELRTKVTNVSSDIGSRSPSVVKDSADLAGTAVRSARHGVAQGALRLNQARLERKEKKINQAIKDSKNQEKFDHIKKVTGTVGAGVTVAKSAISSKARERVIQQEGVEGLQQKQAKLLYLLGDRSKDTKIAVGAKKGLGLIGRVKANAYQRKIDRNREQYRQSLNAQYQPPQVYAPYYYPRAAGFSEDQITALNGILSRDFSSEGAEAFEGLNLSWQPEEYAKLNTILEADFETLDAQIAETQPDMSEKKVKEEEKVDEQQVDDSQSGEIDVSDTIDYDNLDPETMTALIDRSYYEAPEEEKQYQEMIAKGFAEKESSYNNFLESMSNFVDMSL